VVGKAKQATAVVVRAVLEGGARRSPIEITIRQHAGEIRVRAMAYGESRVREVVVVAAAMMAVEASAAVASRVAKEAFAESEEVSMVGHSGEAVVMAWDGCVCVCVR
jgi:hypothetical protein